MKRFILFTTFLFSVLYLNAQDISVKGKYLVHEHETYIVSYNVQKQNPDFVIWRLTDKEAAASEASKIKRPSNFVECKNTQKHNSYTNTKYDRGHMCPCNDRDWDLEHSKDTFRMCNVCPQTHKLNAGVWKSYEDAAHAYAQDLGWIDVCCGPIFGKNTKKILSKNGYIIVPEMFFKIFYNKKYKVLQCFIFTQENECRETTVTEIEKLTGLFFTFY